MTDQLKVVASGEVGRIVIEPDASNQWGKSARIWYADGCMDLPVGNYPLYTHPSSPDVARDAERLRFIQRNYQFAVNTCGGCIEDGINLENEHIDAAMAALEGGE